MRRLPLRVAAYRALNQQAAQFVWLRRIWDTIIGERWIMGAWASQRALFLALTWLVQTFEHPYYLTGPASWQTWGIPWGAWDGGAYHHIGYHGYSDLSFVAYSPLYPALIWLTQWIPLNELLIASLAELAALYLLFDLARRQFGKPTAHRVVLFIAWTPFAAYFAATYTESLFLLLSVGVFWALRRNNLLLAGLCVAAATLTRQLGILLCLPLLGALSWRRVAALAMPAFAFGSFWIGTSWWFHTPFAPLASEQHIYIRLRSWPWQGIINTLAMNDGPHTFFLVEHTVVDLVLITGTLILAGVLLWRFPWRENAYVWASILVVLCLPIHTTATTNIDALASAPRYMMVLFPLAYPVARWASTPMRQRLIMLPLLASVVIFTTFFVAGIWLG
jgi:hypothetical protein